MTITNVLMQDTDSKDFGIVFDFIYCWLLIGRYASVVLVIDGLIGA